MHIQEEHVGKFTFRKSGQVVNDTANREDICLGTDHCRWSQLRWAESKIGDEGVLADSLHEVKVYIDGLCRGKGLDEIQATDFNLSLLGDVDVFRLDVLWLGAVSTLPDDESESLSLKSLKHIKCSLEIFKGTRL